MPPRLSDRRSRSHPRPRSLHLLLLRHRRHYWFFLTLLLLLLLLLLHAAAAPAALRRANALGRRCSAGAAAGGGGGEAAAAASPERRRRIAMVSFAAAEEEGRGNGVGVGGGRRRRSFEGVMEAVEGNKRAYAARMGYDYVDARAAVDPRRPPSWSKILAVRSLLPRYHWVFWNDADTVITNPNISLESILVSAIGHSDFDASPDLVVTEDFGGINAGVFMVRRSRWSARFLDTWWNATSFVQFGSTRSGDNAAMQRLIAALPAEESRAHVRVAPMQCLFNSYPWIPSPKSLYRLILSPRSTWAGAYSDGDFMVHLAGIDDKKRWTAKILQELMMSTS